MKRQSGFVFHETCLFPQCHGSTLETLPDGRLMVAWYGGTRESDPDTAIWCSTLDAGKDEWNDPMLLAKVSQEAHWNPVLFRDPMDNIHLYFKVGNRIPRWVTWHCVMVKGSTVFSDPHVLVHEEPFSRGRGPVRNKMIVLSDGAWLAPASHEKRMSNGKDIWDSFVDISTDNGVTWSESPYVGRLARYGGVIQPAVWESSPGNVHMLLRGTTGHVCRSDSVDHGRSWSEPRELDVPNNNSAVDVVRFDDGTLVMAYNPVSGNWAARTPISLSFSRDNGETWGEPMDVEHSFASRAGFAYPSIIRSPRGIWMTYTWNRVGIRCLEIIIDHQKDKPTFSVVEDMSVPETMLERMKERKRQVALRAGWFQGGINA